jgi:hypothetical protein
MIASATCRLLTENDLPLVVFSDTQSNEWAPLFKELDLEPLVREHRTQEQMRVRFALQGPFTSSTRQLSWARSPSSHACLTIVSDNEVHRSPFCTYLDAFCTMSESHTKCVSLKPTSSSVIAVGNYSALLGGHTRGSGRRVDVTTRPLCPLLSNEVLLLLL